MLIILSWRPKGGGPWPNGPPKYAPESIIIHILFKYCFVVGFRFGFRFIFDFSTVPISKKENKKRNYWLTEEESRTQGSRPRSRTKKFQGQGQDRSRPKTKDTGGKCSLEKKKGLCKNFSGDPPKKRVLSPHFSVELQKIRSSKIFFKWSTKF